MNDSGMQGVSAAVESPGFEQLDPLFKRLGLTTAKAQAAMTARLKNAQLKSIFMIAQYEQERFLIIYGAALEGWARDIYSAARRLVAEHQHQSLLDSIHQRHGALQESPARAVAGKTSAALSFQSLFNESWATLCAPGQVQAWDSPVAYLVSLYRKAGQLECLNPCAGPLKLAELSLTRRRGDLLGVVLSDDQLQTSMSALALINPLLENTIISHTGLDDQAALYQKLASSYYPLSLPFHLPHTQIKSALEQKNTSLGEVFAQLQDLLNDSSPFAPYSPEYRRGYFACNPSENTLWFADDADSERYVDPQLLTVNGGVALSVFCTATGLSKLKVEELICLGAFSLLNAAAAATESGAYYITGAETPVLLENGADGQGFLRCTQQQVLRMLQMIRLQRLVDVPFSQLDGLIRLLEHAQDSKSMLLNVLGMFSYLSGQYALSLELFTVLLGNSMPVVATHASPSLFDRTFNLQGQFDQRLDCNSLPANAHALASCTESTRSQLCAGMDVNAATLDLLAATLDANSGTATPSGLVYCSALYSFVELSKLFGLKPQELLLLGDWLDLKLLAYASSCEDALDKLSRLNAMVLWLRQQQLTVAALQSILSTEIAVLDSDQPVTQFLQQLAILAAQFADEPALANTVIQAVSQYCAVPAEQALHLLTAVGQTTNTLVTWGHNFTSGEPQIKQQAITCATIFTYDLVRYASALAFSGLSTAGIEAWVQHPQWFGCADRKLSLPALYAMRQYALLLNAVSVSEVQLLNYLSAANSAQGSSLATAAKLFSIEIGDFFPGEARAPNTSRQLSALMELQAFAGKAEMSIKTCVDLYVLLLHPNANVEDYYSHWQQVADQVTLSLYRHPH